MKRVIKRAATLPFRLLPAGLRRRLVDLVLASFSDQSPRCAMRVLLEIDEILTGHIDYVAMRYDGGVHVKHRLMKYHDFFVERLRPGEQVLDIGCGYGAVAYSVATRAGAIVMGIDLNRDSIEMARTRFQHPNLTFVNGDALRDLPERTFDAIVFSNVLEHLEHRAEFLRMAQSRLQPKRWLIRVPMRNRDWRVPLREEVDLFPYGDRTHHTEYSQESFEAEMGAAGLAITHLQINWGEIWAEVVPAPSAPFEPVSPTNA